MLQKVVSAPEGYTLITGGNGYLGRHVVDYLKTNTPYQELVVVDNGYNSDLSTFSQFFPDVKLYGEDLGNEGLLMKLINDLNINNVYHLSGHIEAGVSMTVNGRSNFLVNNLVEPDSLLLTFLKAGKKPNIVFASTAAVYGIPERTPILEDDPKNPDNYYGLAKLDFENHMFFYERKHGFKVGAGRFFNIAGNDPLLRFGQLHKNKSHLLEIAALVALGIEINGKILPHLTIFGNDYETRDGTCQRDYVHPTDIASALHLMMEQLRTGKETQIAVNLGTRMSISNLQVMEAVKKVTTKYKLPFNYIMGDRRPGDPAILQADSTRAKTMLGWQPQYTDIEQMFEQELLFLAKHYGKTLVKRD